MDVGSLLLGLALVLVIAFIIAQPLLEKTSVRERPANPADQLLSRRDQVLTQLRDLDFDSAMGKINAEDYAAQRAQLVAEGVAILKQLDALGAAVGQLVVGGAEVPAARLAAGDTVANAAANAVVPADEIEAAVARLRARRAAANRPAATLLPAQVSVTSRLTSAPRNLDAEIEANVDERRNNGAGRLAAADKPGAPEKPACVQCGAEVLPNDRFCPKCGSPLTIACANCGSVARAGDLFCAGCGQPLPAPTGGLRQAKAQS